MANLKRNGTVNYTNGSYISPGLNYWVNTYAPGAISKGSGSSGSSTVINVYDTPGFLNNGTEYLMIGLDTTKIYRVTAVTTTPGSASITVSGNISVPADQVILFNIGADTGGGAAPTWVQAGTNNAQIYNTPDTSEPITNSIVYADQNGTFSYYFPVSTPIWELIHNTAGTPVQITIGTNTANFSSNGSSFVDTAIARWSGTDGLHVQSNYTVNSPVTAPTIADNGNITARGAATFGQTGNTTTIAGAASVGQTLAVTGATTLTGALTANSTTTLNGATTIAGAITQTGAGATTLSGALSVTGDTAVAKFNASHIAANIASVPTVPLSGSIGSGWGTTSTAAFLANSTDNRFTVTVTTSGTTFANPATLVVHFGTAFTTIAPQAIVVMNQPTAGSPGTVAALNWSATTTDLTIVYQAQPAVSKTYTFSVILLG